MGETYPSVKNNCSEIIGYSTTIWNRFHKSAVLCVSFKKYMFIWRALITTYSFCIWFKLHWDTYIHGVNCHWTCVQKMKYIFMTYIYKMSHAIARSMIPKNVQNVAVKYMTIFWLQILTLTFHISRKSLRLPKGVIRRDRLKKDRQHSGIKALFIGIRVTLLVNSNSVTIHVQKML